MRLDPWAWSARLCLGDGDGMNPLPTSKRPATAPNAVGDCAQASLYLAGATRSRARILIGKTSVLGVVIEAPLRPVHRVKG